MYRPRSVMAGLDPRLRFNKSGLYVPIPAQPLILRSRARPGPSTPSSRLKDAAQLKDIQLSDLTCCAQWSSLDPAESTKFKTTGTRREGCSSR